MKRFLFLTIACLFSICGMAQIVADTYVEVLYFHGKQPVSYTHLTLPTTPYV